MQLVPRERKPCGACCQPRCIWQREPLACAPHAVNPRQECTPNDLYDEYFLPGHLFGARVHSSSWGGFTAQGYTTSELDIDLFAWRSQS